MSTLNPSAISSSRSLHRYPFPSVDPWPKVTEPPKGISRNLVPRWEVSDSVCVRKSSLGPVIFVLQPEEMLDLGRQ
ncbi:hypothetical protein CGCF413_v013113 [Colletotrichum fructicola]|nr:hypothetical protein CGCF413_v013113 [Colletotrichum fructicola]